MNKIKKNFKYYFKYDFLYYFLFGNIFDSNLFFKDNIKNNNFFKNKLLSFLVNEKILIQSNSFYFFSPSFCSDVILPFLYHLTDNQIFNKSFSLFSFNFSKFRNDRINIFSLFYSQMCNFFFHNHNVLLMDTNSFPLFYNFNFRYTINNDIKYKSFSFNDYYSFLNLKCTDKKGQDILYDLLYANYYIKLLYNLDKNIYTIGIFDFPYSNLKYENIYDILYSKIYNHQEYFYDINFNIISFDTLDNVINKFKLQKVKDHYISFYNNIPITLRFLPYIINPTTHNNFYTYFSFMNSPDVFSKKDFNVYNTDDL